MSDQLNELELTLPDNKTWNQVSENRPAVPAGIYTATIEKVVPTEKEGVKRVRIQCDLGITDGPFKKSKAFLSYEIAPNPDFNGIKFLMNRAGIEVSGNSFKFGELIGRVVSIRMETEMKPDASGMVTEQNKFPQLVKA